MHLPRRRALIKRAALALAMSSAQRLGWAQGGTGTGAGPQRAGMDLNNVYAYRSDEGVILGYNVRLELPHEVEDALLKGVAVVFVAKADVFRERWYWRDKVQARVERRWRLAYQPLTRRWRVTFDGLSQHYNTLGEALGVMARSSRWRVLEWAPPTEDRDYYIEFNFELDRDELPRPMQIGLSDQNEWTLSVFKRVPIAPTPAAANAR
jgi:hypothetical protein